VCQGIDFCLFLRFLFDFQTVPTAGFFSFYM
jgi:hypothetical protein